MTKHTESKTVCILIGNCALPTHSAHVILVYYDPSSNPQVFWAAVPYPSSHISIHTT